MSSYSGDAFSTLLFPLFNITKAHCQEMTHTRHGRRITKSPSLKDEIQRLLVLEVKVVRFDF